MYEVITQLPIIAVTLYLVLDMLGNNSGGSEQNKHSKRVIPIFLPEDDEKDK
jgi:hypothetical protein